MKISKQNSNAPKFRPSSVTIFEESDGYHFCDASLGYLDARGAAYPSKAAAMRAARQSFADKAAYLS